MKTSRIFFTILLVIIVVIAVAVLFRWITNGDSTELALQSANTEYTQWHLPEGAKARLGKGSINEIKYSPDGTRFAVATTIGIWIYDAQTGAEIFLCQGDRQDIKGMSFSSDGKFLIGANFKGEILRWNSDNGEQLSPLLQPTEKIRISTIFSGDGRKLASVGRPMEGGIHVFNLGENIPQSTITSMDVDFKVGYNTVIALSTDKRILASTTQAKRDKNFSFHVPIQVYDTDSGETMYLLDGHNGRIRSLSFSPDGETLASASNDETKLWNLDTKTSQATFRAPGTSFTKSMYSPNGKLLASGCRDGSVRLWNATAEQKGLGGKIGQFMPTLILNKHKDEISALAFSPDGRMLLTGSRDGTIRAWETATGRQQYICGGHSVEISGIAKSQEKNILKSVHSWRDTQIQQWDIDNRNLISVSILKRTISPSISPDTTTLALMNLKGKNKIQLWDISKKDVISTLEGHGYPSNGLNLLFAFTLDRTMLASACAERNNVIHLWDIPIRPRSFFQKVFSGSKTIHPRYTLDGHKGSIQTLAFSPDGTMLASGGRDSMIHLWEVDTGNTLLTLTGHDNKITGLAFSPDGNRLVSASFLVIYIWDVETGQLLTKSQPTTTPMNLQFSPNGKIVVSGRHDGTIKLWDAQTLSLLSTFKVHTDRINGLMFSEDGNTLISASQDGTMIIWDWNNLANN